MQELAELLVERGPLTPGTLKKKMDVRVFLARYFEPLNEGRYACKTG
jgi:hypothetical protein